MSSDVRDLHVVHVGPQIQWQLLAHDGKSLVLNRQRRCTARLVFARVGCQRNNERSPRAEYECQQNPSTKRSAISGCSHGLTSCGLQLPRLDACPFPPVATTSSSHNGNISELSAPGCNPEGMLMGGAGMHRFAGETIAVLERKLKQRT